MANPQQVEPVRTRIKDDSFVIEIFLGSPAADRYLGFMQLTVMLIGLIILMPDTRQFRFGLDASLVIRSGFAMLWTAIGVTITLRTIVFPPRPAILHFTPETLRFDSGRAGLRYLGDQYENDLTRLYRTAVQWRRNWTVSHPADHNSSSWNVVASGWNLQLKSDQGTYNFGVAIPESQHAAIRSTVLAWVQSQPSSAVTRAERAFDQTHSVAGISP